nr:phytanoyl-CoA dioxygenase family protein [Sphingopyxis sp. BSNA05]
MKGIVGLSERIGVNSRPWEIVRKHLDANAQPVRAILFDKNVETNWSLDWHQDRTIAVAKRKEVSGFKNWTIKQGIQHVEPPFELLADMVTLRIHLDDVGPDSAPLRIAPGSHKLGWLAEDDYASAIVQCGEAECLAKSGDIWSYSTPILHASKSAARPQRRRVLQVDYSSSSLPAELQWAGI